MKVLFAVNNEKISETIMKRYQKDYKEIISGKNVYYFNAILKELQKDKSYDRIVISEDLEPFSNNNYEAIDKFIYDKLDRISDEAFNSEGSNIPIILIGTDRRTRPEPLLVRIFGIGVYDVLIGQDRSVEKVCELINRPRSKKEAKIYYKIGNDNFEYKQENENSVSEDEIQNILSHYKKIGKNQEKYIESFNSISEQYNDEQLKVIISFLPNTVTQVLSENSDKYKQLMGITGSVVNNVTNKKSGATKQKTQQIEFIEKELKKQKLTKPVIIPTTVDTSNVKKVEDQQEELLKKEKERKAELARKRAELKKQKELEKQEKIRKEKQEEKRRQEELRKQEEKRRQEELRKQEEKKRQEELRKQEEKRRQEELRKQEEKRRQEELRKQEEKRRQEELRKQEEKRRQEELRKQEEKKRQEELRKQEEKEKQEELRKQEEKKKKRGRPSKEDLEDDDDDDDDLPNVDKIAADESSKRRRGRPAKKKVEEDKNNSVIEESEDVPVKKSNDEDILLGFDDIEDNEEEDEDILPGFDEDDEDIIEDEEDDDDDEDILPGFDDEDEDDEDIIEDDEEEDEDILPGFDDEDEDDEDIIEDDEEEEEDILPGFDEDDEDDEDIIEDDEDDEDIIEDDEEEDEDILPGFDEDDEDDDEDDIDDDIDKLLADMEDKEENKNAQISNPNFVRMNPLSAQKVEQPQNSKEIENVNRINTNVNFNIDNLISSNQKMVAFIGTSKNGTSFLVNNLAEMLSQKGIKTAILDLTKNRNAYYIYTDNQEERKMIAHECINGLKNGVAKGIKINKNLDVYTTLPDEIDDLGDVANIVPTLLNNYSLVLLDCDFETEYQYFNVVQEIYLVQSLDILTIQPLTAFLRELKAKGILDPNKLRVVVNKYIKLRQITDKAVIGGMSLYNDPSMSFMTELFNVNTIKSILIPFESQIYAKYLDSLYDGKITVKGYSKNFIQSLEKLGNMVFPLINGNKKNNTQYVNNYNFSVNTNNTLDKMKNKY